MNFRTHSNNSGFTILVSIFILGALGLFVILSLTLNSADATISSNISVQAGQARSIATSCAETALQKLQDVDCQTAGVISYQFGFCNYTIIGTGQARTIRASSTVGQMVKKVLVTTSLINPSIVVSSWREVEGF